MISLLREGAPCKCASYPNPATITGSVYLASPLTTHDTPRYDRMLSAVRAAFPNVALLPARYLYASNAHRRRAWPGVLARLTGLVFFADDEPIGWIDASVWREVGAADARGIPVWHLCVPTAADTPSLTPLEGVIAGLTDGRDRARIALVGRTEDMRPLIALWEALSSDPDESTDVHLCSICGSDSDALYPPRYHPTLLTHICAGCRPTEEAIHRTRENRRLREAPPDGDTVVS